MVIASVAGSLALAPVHADCWSVPAVPRPDDDQAEAASSLRCTRSNGASRLDPWECFERRLKWGGQNAPTGVRAKLTLVSNTRLISPICRVSRPSRSVPTRVARAGVEQRKKKKQKAPSRRVVSGLLNALSTRVDQHPIISPASPPPGLSQVRQRQPLGRGLSGRFPDFGGKGLGWHGVCAADGGSAGTAAGVPPSACSASLAFTTACSSGVTAPAGSPSIPTRAAPALRAWR
jgi:hypothetical protein